MSGGPYWKIAVNAPLAQPLTYLAPPELTSQIRRGASVRVPLGRREVTGVVLDSGENDSSFEIRAITSVDSERPVLPESLTRWLEWLASYYIHPVGLIFEQVFPPLPKHSSRKTRKAPAVALVEPTPPPEPTEQQNEVLRRLLPLAGFDCHLIHGVTGSGKTEVYIRVIEDCLKQDRSALVLVPEIALTPQLVHRFSARLGDAVAVIHSQLTPREKTNQWWSIADGQKKVLIGARSALFCPIENLGVIIVDEEHEASFKQDEKLKYHGRDAAVMRAKQEDCPIVLGSATPSMESWYNVNQGRYKLHEMRSRVGERPLPEMILVDMKRERSQAADEFVGHADQPFWMSAALYKEIELNLKNREQSVLFLNRRGLAPSVMGPKSGESPSCPNCDIGLTLHGGSHLVCHYCNYHDHIEQVAKSMGEDELIPLGVGTELIEEDLRKLFPSARLARADRDEIQSREELENLILQMESSEIDILIGTQMIAKGLDFPNLTLVGLVLADIGFNMPDFRACERSYQLLNQVAGRAGRDLKPGRVLIQTYNPHHPVFEFVPGKTFPEFAEFELRMREQLHYPPVWRLASLRLQGLHKDRVERTAQQLARTAKQWSQNSAFSEIQVLGPAPAPLFRLRNQYRFHILIKAPRAPILGEFCRRLESLSAEFPAGVRLLVDMDPQNLM